MNFYKGNNILNPQFNPNYTINERMKKYENQKKYREILNNQIIEKKKREKIEKENQLIYEYKQNEKIKKEEEELK